MSTIQLRADSISDSQAQPKLGWPGANPLRRLRRPTSQQRTHLVPLCVKGAASSPVVMVRRRWLASMSFVRWGAPH